MKKVNYKDQDNKFVKDKIFLVTGGTGSFGETIVKFLLSKRAKEIRILSRDEKKQDTTVEKKEETGNILGIAVKDIGSLTDQEQKQLGQDKGVVVSSVSPGPASEAGIRRGDIIDKIQFKDVGNIKDYEKISKTLKKGSTIALRIIRDKNGSFLTLKIPK